MSDIFSSFILVFAGLFPVVNPLGAAPIFLSLTADCTAEQRDRLAWNVAFNGFWLLFGSLFFGAVILEFFGIGIPVVRVAGGLLVAAMGWNLISGDSASSDHKTIDPDSGPPQSFYPLTLPLTVGPGAIAVAITFGSHRAPGKSATHHMLVIAAAIGGLLAVAASIYVCFRFAERLSRTLGQTGINVLIRLSAFILICIGIQICWSGISKLVAELGH